MCAWLILIHFLMFTAAEETKLQNTPSGHYLARLWLSYCAAITTHMLITEMAKVWKIETVGETFLPARPTVYRSPTAGFWPSAPGPAITVTP